MRRAIVGVIILVSVLAAFVYYRSRDLQRETTGSAAERLQPVSAQAPSAAVRRTVYVPVYSSLSLGRDIKRDVVELAATLSIRNISPRYPIVLESVGYYDSVGRLVKEHLTTPSELGALASVEFLVKETDQTGGPGANFLVRWAGPSEVDEPLIEAVMLGRSGNAGISFTSRGQVVTNP